MSEADYGFIKLYRKTLNSQVFVSEKTFKIWLWCLLKANFTSKWVPLKSGKGSVEVNVKRGHFIFGRNKAAEELSMKASTVNLHMKKLVKMGNIIMDSNNQYSMIKICKYEFYQGMNSSDITSKELVTDSEMTSQKQVTDTTKKEKKEKKEVKNENSNPEYAQFIMTFNTKTGKLFKGDPTSMKQFDACLSEGYSVSDIVKALNNCFEDEFHKNNPKYLTPEFITRKEKLEKYLNSGQKENRPDNLKKMVF